MSGDGGDELFGGYERYHWGARLWQKLARIPRPLRQATAGLLRQIPARAWNTVAALGAPMLPSQYRSPSFGAKLRVVGDLLTARSQEELYVRQMSLWSEREEVVRMLSGRRRP